MHFVREILLRNVKYACGVWIYFISLLISKFASSKLFHIERYARYFTHGTVFAVAPVGHSRFPTSRV